MPVLDVLAVAAVLAAAWYVHLCCFPLKPCPRCNGTGERRFLTDAAFRICGRCDREREVPRMLAPKFAVERKRNGRR